MTLQLLDGVEAQVTRKTFLTLALKQPGHTETVRYQHLLHLLCHGGIHEVGPVLDLILVFQPSQETPDWDLAEPADEVGRLAVRHELGQGDVDSLRPPASLWAGTSLYHSSRFSPPGPLVPGSGQRLPDDVRRRTPARLPPSLETRSLPLLLCLDTLPVPEMSAVVSLGPEDLQTLPALSSGISGERLVSYHGLLHVNVGVVELLQRSLLGDGVLGQVGLARPVPQPRGQCPHVH